MHINWTQKAWHKKDKRSIERVCWRWEGKRADGRTFLVIHIPHLGYIASTFNGTKLGTGKTLAEAQAFCAAAVKPKENLGKIARPASSDYASGTTTGAVAKTA